MIYRLAKYNLQSNIRKIAISFLTNLLLLIITIIMPNIYHNIKNKISKAVKLLISHKKPNITKTTYEFYVLLLRLGNYINSQ